MPPCAALSLTFSYRIAIDWGVARRRNIDGGKTRGFYLGDQHLRALDEYRLNHRHANNGAALRAILDIVAETEGLAPDRQKKAG